MQNQQNQARPMFGSDYRRMGVEDGRRGVEPQQVPNVYFVAYKSGYNEGKAEHDRQHRQFGPPKQD